jgi:hypothetical protein
MGRDADMSDDELQAALNAVAAERPNRDQLREDWGYHKPHEEVLYEAVIDLQAERDRLQGLLAQTVDGGEWVLIAPSVIERLNTERDEAVIDAERERACRQIVDQALLDAVNERDALQATLDTATAQWLKETRHAASRIGESNRERDRLRALLAEGSQGVMSSIKWVAGIYEFPMTPNLSTRFGYCPDCQMVWPPQDTHECKGANDE